jgi:acetoin utilization protein AcuB
MAAMMLIRSGRFRHLPVVDGEGRLAGIVGRDDLALFLARAGSPGVAKRQHHVDQVMIRMVVTVPPDCPLEEAAARMVAHKIGSLPVMEAGRLVGIITETDIFKQFVAALGGGSDSLRLTIRVENAPGQLAEVAGRIAKAGGNISSAVAYPASETGKTSITLRVEGVDREPVLVAIAGMDGLEVLHTWECEEEAR